MKGDMSVHHLTARIEKLRNAIIGKADAFLITDDISRRYVFGFDSSAGTGVVTQNRAVLFLDFRYYEKALVEQNEGRLPADISILPANGTRTEMIGSFFKEENISRVLFEDRRTTFYDFQILQKHLCDICFLPSDGIIEHLRAAKDEYELSMIEKAQSITDSAFTHIVSFIKKGMTESEVTLELEYFMRKNGADGLAFDTICVSGKKTSMPHGTPDNTVIGDGFLTLDFGARFGGYCSDMTRTICVGKPDSDMLKIYDTVLKAQAAAFERIKEGVCGSYVDAAARDLIYDAGYEGCFGHSTGHSLGLEIHESPNFSPRETNKIPGNSVLSVEPGIYIEGKYGVRIEDIVILTENGYKNLTNSTKDIIII